MAKIINFNESAKIDSLRIEILLSDIKILNPILDNELYLVTKDGEILDEQFKENSHPVKENGITTRYVIQSRYDFKSKSNIKYLNVLFNSKLLEYKYFEGIQKTTIKEVYNKIISQKIVYFTYKTFSSGKVSDVDICKDFYKLDVGFDRLIDEVQKIVKSHKRVSIKTFNRKGNKGLQLSERTAQNPNKLPFLKWYSKVNELRENSQEFYSVYFKDYIERDLGKWVDQYKCIRRVEVTIKNRKHLGFLLNNLKVDNTLKYLLSIDFDEVIKKIIATYVDTQKSFKPMKDLPPTKTVVAFLAQSWLNDSDSDKVSQDIVEMVGDLFNNKTEKKRMKDLVRDMINVDITGQKKQVKERSLIAELTTGNFPTMM